MSLNFNSNFLQTVETPNKHGNSYTITQNSDTITETPDFCLIVRFLPLSPSYQRHPKTKKLGFTTHRDEPHQTSKSLDFKPFFHTFACEYPKSYGINLRLPPGRLLDIVQGIQHIFHINSPRRRGIKLDKGRGQNCDHRGHIHSHRGQTFWRRGQHSHRGVRFMTTVAVHKRRSHIALAQPQKQTRNSSNT